MTTAPVKSAETPTFPALTMSTRCDATASGSEQAVVKVVKDNKELNLCSHHAYKHEIILGVEGWIVREDIRATAINVKPSPSANTDQFKETPDN
jgi:hypothetical protein